MIRAVGCRIDDTKTMWLLSYLRGHSDRTMVSNGEAFCCFSLSSFPRTWTGRTIPRGPVSEFLLGLLYTLVRRGIGRFLWFAMTFYCPLREHHSCDQLVFLTGLLTVLFFFHWEHFFACNIGSWFPLLQLLTVSHFSPLHTLNSIVFLFSLEKTNKQP